MKRELVPIFFYKRYTGDVFAHFKWISLNLLAPKYCGFENREKINFTYCREGSLPSYYCSERNGDRPLLLFMLSWPAC